MLVLYIAFNFFLSTVDAFEYVLSEAEILTNLSVVAFLDDNRYIRLNISWENVTDKVDEITIRFLDIEDSKCSAIDGVDRFSVLTENNLIIPHPSLTNPVDNLANGCEYEIIIETHDLDPNLEQSLMYKIPDCVQDRCICKQKSPYQLNSIIPSTDGSYFLQWNKLSDENLSLLDIYYIREDNSTVLTQVKESSTTDDGVQIMIPDVKEDVSYKITARFYYDGCFYTSWIRFKVPSTRNKWSIISPLLLSIICFTFVLFTIVISSRKLREKIKRYTNHLICWEDNVDAFAIRPMPARVIKEEFNSQYTPLEFVLNAYKYDKFEFPRNKVVMKGKIGEGAFGAVYYGEAFEIGKNTGYTKVAVKKLKHDAPDEQKEDLRSEIEILEKVGEHKNIIKLLGCVTIDQPYMMILELVPCGSLKDYLLKVREKWTTRKSRFFFAEDKLDKLNYTRVVFDTTYNSNIIPDSFAIDDGLLYKPEQRAFNMPRNKLTEFFEMSKEPQSPTSIASSALLSCADTELTTLPSTPELEDIHNEYVRSVEPLLDNNELENFARQIARGMAYLETINITHRDLAARNILMTNDKVLKISDFGLSRVGVYVSKQGQKLPLRWMSIEAIEEKICTNKSDVWSFGVVLWEIGTLGAFPYSKINDNMILYELKMGKRLERPQVCTDELYNLLLKCWNDNPQDRPTFAELLDQLEMEQKKTYVGFDKLNPAYVFPPSREPKST